MSDPCPAIEELRAFAAGSLPADRMEEIESHLCACERCCVALDTEAKSSFSELEVKLLNEPDDLDRDSQKRLAERIKANPTWDGEGEGEEKTSPPDLSFLEPAPDDANLLGRLDRYEVLEFIGQGGMGIVLKAIDPELKRTVAVKVLAPHLGNSSRARRRFLREARTVAVLDHDNVVPVHAVEGEGPLP